MTAGLVQVQPTRDLGEAERFVRVVCQQLQYIEGSLHRGNLTSHRLLQPARWPYGVVAPAVTLDDS
ncbi:hypothetical protein MXD62_26235 [Frankia sp. Mgl5]|nr:hypothetical protein [Frankia sp. Mgl5]